MDKKNINDDIERARNLALFGIYKSNKQIGDMVEGIPTWFILGMIGLIVTCFIIAAIL